MSAGKSSILAAPFWFVASYTLNPAKIRTNLFHSKTTIHRPHFLS